MFKSRFRRGTPDNHSYKPPPDDRYATRIGYNPEHPEADIIFVHGINGHPVKTWRHVNGDEDCFWPQHLLPAEVPKCRIILTGYDSRLMGENATSHSLASLARYVAADIRRLRDNDESQGRPIIFIAYSTGGLIVKAILSQELVEKSSSTSNILSNTKDIIFLGTPHRGVKLLGFSTLYWMLRAMGLLPTLPYRKQLAPESETLYELSLAFSKVLERTSINIISCYETIPSSKMPTFPNHGFIVSEKEAVIGLPNETPFPIDKNHRGLACMTGANDSQYQRLVVVITNALAARKEQSGPSEWAVAETTTGPPETRGPVISLPHREDGDGDNTHPACSADPSFLTFSGQDSSLVPTSIELVLGVDTVTVDAVLDVEGAYNLISRGLLSEHGIDFGGERYGPYRLYFRDKMTKRLQSRWFFVTDDVDLSHQIILAPSASSAVTEASTSVVLPSRISSRTPSRSPSTQSSSQPRGRQASSTARTSFTVSSVERELLGIPSSRSWTRRIETNSWATQPTQERGSLSYSGPADMVPANSRPPLMNGLGLPEPVLNTTNAGSIDIISPPPPRISHPITPTFLSRVGSSAVRAAEETAQQSSQATTIIAGVGAGVAGVTALGALGTQIYNANTARKALTQSTRSADLAASSLAHNRRVHAYNMRKDALAARKKKRRRRPKLEPKAPLPPDLPSGADPEVHEEDPSDYDTDDTSAEDGNNRVNAPREGASTNLNAQRSRSALPEPASQPSRLVKATSSKGKKPMRPVSQGNILVTLGNNASASVSTTQRPKSTHQERLLATLTTLPSPSVDALPIPGDSSSGSPSVDDLPISGGGSDGSKSMLDYDPAIHPSKDSKTGGFHDDIELQALQKLPRPPQTDPSCTQDHMADSTPATLIPAQGEAESKLAVYIPPKETIQTAPHPTPVNGTAPLIQAAALTTGSHSPDRDSPTPDQPDPAETHTPPASGAAASETGVVASSAVSESLHCSAPTDLSQSPAEAGVSPSEIQAPSLEPPSPVLSIKDGTIDAGPLEPMHLQATPALGNGARLGEGEKEEGEEFRE